MWCCNLTPDLFTHPPWTETLSLSNNNTHLPFFFFESCTHTLSLWHFYFCFLCKLLAIWCRPKATISLCVEYFWLCQSQPMFGKCNPNSPVSSLILMESRCNLWVTHNVTPSVAWNLTGGTCIIHKSLKPYELFIPEAYQSIAAPECPRMVEWMDSCRSHICWPPTLFALDT